MKTPKIIGPDGITRTPDQDSKINETFFEAFQGAAGEAVIDYLKSITINRISGPESSAEYLRHLEGQRSIVALILTRYNQGLKRKKHGAE